MKRLFPFSRGEWRVSIIGWLISLIVLAVWGVVPAAIVVMIGAGVIWAHHIVKHKPVERPE